MAFVLFSLFLSVISCLDIPIISNESIVTIDTCAEVELDMRDYDPDVFIDICNFVATCFENETDAVVEVSGRSGSAASALLTGTPVEVQVGLTNTAVLVVRGTNDFLANYSQGEIGSLVFEAGASLSGVSGASITVGGSIFGQSLAGFATLGSPDNHVTLGDLGITRRNESSSMSLTVLGASISAQYVVGLTMDVTFGGVTNVTASTSNNALVVYEGHTATFTNIVEGLASISGEGSVVLHTSAGHASLAATDELAGVSLTVSGGATLEAASGASVASPLSLTGGSFLTIDGHATAESFVTTSSTVTIAIEADADYRAGLEVDGDCTVSGTSFVLPGALPDRVVLVSCGGDLTVGGNLTVKVGAAAAAAAAAASTKRADDHDHDEPSYEVKQEGRKLVAVKVVHDDDSASTITRKLSTVVAAAAALSACST